ncbi:MAG: WD40 domain-containing protein, partial [Chloroflexi bacterium OLB15]
MKRSLFIAMMTLIAMFYSAAQALDRHPAEEQIAFYSFRDADLEIYVMNADGSNVRRLTNTAGEDSQPAWSPDSTQIAFMSDRDGNREIYVMNADGSNVRRLTYDEAWDRTPAWSPDGSA